MMSEELHVDLAEGQGPPELIIKLALQYLPWKELFSVSRDKPLLTSVGVVCKKWKELLETDEVGRPLCLNLLKLYDDLLVIRNGNKRAVAEQRGQDFQEDFFCFKSHELLAKIMKDGPPPGRSYKDAFVLSEKMGEYMDDFEFIGPDVAKPNDDNDTRSLREASIQDYRCIIRPTIERLRGVFGNHDDNTEEQLKDVAEMKKRLLQHARGNERTMLLRKNSLRIEKEELAEDAGRMMLMLAASNDLGKKMFVPSSLPASMSLEEVIQGLETIKGGEIEVQLSLQVRRTSSGVKRKFSCLPGHKKQLATRIDELYWPQNPVDSINFLLRQLIPDKNRVKWEDDYYDATEEVQEQIWNDTVTKFWLELGEPVRQFLVTVYNDDVASRFIDTNHIPMDTPAREVPLDKLKQICDLPYEFFRKKIADRILRDMEPSLCEQIFEVYHRQKETFCEALQEEYANVYSETSSLEHNAKVLLDIFLEVPSRHDDFIRFPGSMTTEACDTFVERMEETMNRWNELIDLVNTDDDVLWDPQTLTELDSFDLMFGHTFVRRRRTLTLEFCVPELVTEFLYRSLSSTQQIPKRGEFENEVGKFWDDYASLVGRMGTNTQTFSFSTPLPYSESVERETRRLRLVQDFRALTSYIYTRDHAMIALVPLLPHLSRHDCKRLVYALFIQREDDRHIPSKWKYSNCRFSRSNFSSLGMEFMKKIPCALGDDSDLLLLLKWHQDQTFDFSNDYKILGYIFGVPLPDNIISSMGEFMVENLYQGNITDVNTTKTNNVRMVTLFLQRFCYERPKSAHIVWDYLREALENAIAVVEDLPEIENEVEIQPAQRSDWVDVIKLLVVSCIEVRAKRLLSHLRRLYQGAPLALLPENFVGFRALVERVKQKPLILNDTLEFHQLHEF